MTERPNLYLTAEEAERVNAALKDATETIRYLRRMKNKWRNIGLLGIGYVGMDILYPIIKEFVLWAF